MSVTIYNLSSIYHSVSFIIRTTSAALLWLYWYPVAYKISSIRGIQITIVSVIWKLESIMVLNKYLKFIHLKPLLLFSKVIRNIVASAEFPFLLISGTLPATI